MAKLFNDVRNFLQGTFYAYLDKHQHLSPHIKEQALHRASLCSSCLEAGHCDLCGCKTPDMFFAPLKEDARKRWGPMVSQEEWPRLKREELFKRFTPSNDTKYHEYPVPENEMYIWKLTSDPTNDMVQRSATLDTVINPPTEIETLEYLGGLLDPNSTTSYDRSTGHNTGYISPIPGASADPTEHILGGSMGDSTLLGSEISPLQTGSQVEDGAN